MFRKPNQTDSITPKPDDFVVVESQEDLDFLNKWTSGCGSVDEYPVWKSLVQKHVVKNKLSPHWNCKLFSRFEMACHDAFGVQLNDQDEEQECATLSSLLAEIECAFDVTIQSNIMTHEKHQKVTVVPLDLHALSTEINIWTTNNLKILVSDYFKDNYTRLSQQNINYFDKLVYLENHFIFPLINVINRALDRCDAASFFKISDEDYHQFREELQSDLAEFDKKMRLKPHKKLFALLIATMLSLFGQRDGRAFYKAISKASDESKVSDIVKDAGKKTKTDRVQLQELFNNAWINAKFLSKEQQEKIFSAQLRFYEKGVLKKPEPPNVFEEVIRDVTVAKGVDKKLSAIYRSRAMSHALHVLVSVASVVAIATGVIIGLIAFKVIAISSLAVLLTIAAAVVVGAAFGAGILVLKGNIEESKRKEQQTEEIWARAEQSLKKHLPVQPQTKTDFEKRKSTSFLDLSVPTPFTQAKLARSMKFLPTIHSDENSKESHTSHPRMKR